MRRLYNLCGYVFDLEYLIVPIVLFGLIGRWLEVWHLSNNDIDNARYFLSATAQSLATIFTIIITVSLIILQLLTQMYTYKIFSYYLRRPVVMFFFFFVAITIILNLILITTLDAQAKPEFIDILILFAAASLIWLLPYLHEMIQSLDPRRVLNYLESIARNDNMTEIIQVVGEICHVAIENGKLETARLCIDVFNNLYNDISESYSEYYYEQLDNLASLAIQRHLREVFRDITSLSVSRPLSDWFKREYAE